MRSRPRLRHNAHHALQPMRPHDRHSRRRPCLRHDPKPSAAASTQERNVNIRHVSKESLSAKRCGPTAYQVLRNSSGSFATFTAILLAASLVSNFAADRRPGSFSK